MITHAESNTCVDEVASGVYRICTPVTIIPGGFSFNRYLIVDDTPVLYHTGPRRMFPLTQGAVAAVIPLEELRYISFSHYENDETGALNELLAVAPNAVPLCGRVNAMVNGDTFDRPAKVLADGEDLSIGQRTVRWLDAPHMPHAWECGHLFETTTRTLFCSDLFTQPGPGDTALTEGDILGPSEALRKNLDYFSHTRAARALVERLAKEAPATLACMHGSAWRGDGAALLRALADRLS